MKNRPMMLVLLLLTGCADTKPVVTPVTRNNPRTRAEIDRERLRNPDGRQPSTMAIDRYYQNPQGSSSVPVDGAKIGFPIPLKKEN